MFWGRSKCCTGSFLCPPPPPLPPVRSDIRSVFLPVCDPLPHGAPRPAGRTKGVWFTATTGPCFLHLSAFVYCSDVSRRWTSTLQLGRKLLLSILNQNVHRNPHRQHIWGCLSATLSLEFLLLDSLIRLQSFHQTELWVITAALLVRQACGSRFSLGVI